jgi:5-methylcytosine-specific restriction protein A
MSRKYCASFPCSNMAESGSSYCQEHKRPDAPKETDPFYLSVRWRRFRACYLGKHPLCEVCEQEGRLTPAAMVDHIIEVKDGGDLTTEDNAMSMCFHCHNTKTATERNKRKNHQQSKHDNRLVSQRRTY